MKRTLKPTKSASRQALDKIRKPTAPPTQPTHPSEELKATLAQTSTREFNMSNAKIVGFNPATAEEQRVKKVAEQRKQSNRYNSRNIHLVKDASPFTRNFSQLDRGLMMVSLIPTVGGAA